MRGFYVFNNSPGDKEFIEEYGTDWYTRRHVNDLARDKAEIISRDELLEMYNKNPSTELEILLEMTKKNRKT
jgi:hypothetical protein